MAYAKTETANLKKLDNRSRTLVHLKTEPESKAYRLFDPTLQKIVVSREVVFDESKTWDWNKTRGEAAEKPGMFRVSLGDHGNQGLGNDNDEAGSDLPDENIQEEEIADKENSDQQDDGETEHSHGNGETEDLQPRRSTRTIKRPSYLDDYICLAEE